MNKNLSELAAFQIARIPTTYAGGRVIEVSGAIARIDMKNAVIKRGDRVDIFPESGRVEGTVVMLSGAYVDALVDGGVDGIAIGDRAVAKAPAHLAPHESWMGRVIDPDGIPLDGKPMLAGVDKVTVDATPPAAHARRKLGARIETGHAVFNTLLPIVRGQRLGLFAGSGVGKSTLIGDLARKLDADVVVVALVGERGRELGHFVDEILGPEGLMRSVVVAATSDRSPYIRRRCAPAAMAVAEHFRDQGCHVLLLVDSVTRFCEAHRELAVAGREPANLRGFPASTSPAIARLCERAGPGSHGQGDITAIFSVLVAGSDMEEPVADMLRGVLDGHIVLEREIAERGRFPAVDILKSVSRSLPDAASAIENDLIADARQTLGKYEQSALMIQSGLYIKGSDSNVDRAVACEPKLDKFIALKDDGNAISHFAKLRQALSVT